MKKIILYIVFCWTSLSFGFQEKAIQNFEKANEAYNNAKYEQSASLYQSIVDDGYVSVEVYYNLGNAYLKQNKLAEAIYAYEKALSLKPNADFVKENLEYAKTMTIDQFAKVEVSDFQKMINQVNHLLTTDQWAYLVVIFLFLMVLSFLIYLFKTQPKLKRIGFSMFSVFLILAVISLWQAYRLSQQTKQEDFAILFDEEIEVYAEPNPRSEAILSLHEGTKIQLLTKFNDYQEIKLPDGTKVWMRNANYQTIE